MRSTRKKLPRLNDSNPKPLPSLEAINKEQKLLDKYSELESSFEPCPSIGDYYVPDWVNTGWVGFINLDLVLSYGIASGASDIHLAANQQICFTILGDIVKQTIFSIPDSETLSDIEKGVLTNEADAIYVRDREYDTSYEIRFGPYKSRRFRVSVGKSFGNDFLVFRTISDDIPTKESLGVESEVSGWFENSSGAILVCGPTGSGKSLHKDTIVHTETGSKIIGDIEIGESVIDKDGTLTKVVDIHKADVTDVFYLLKFTNGEEIRCSGRHDWYLYNDKALLSKVDTDWIFNNKKYNIYLPKITYPINLINGESAEERRVIYNNLLEEGDKVQAGLGLYTFPNKEYTDLVVYYGSSLGYEVKYISADTIFVNKKSKLKGNQLASIELIEDDYRDYYCLEVDSISHSYLIGNTCIPTHNSTTTTAILRDIQLRENKKIITIEKPIEAIYPNDGKSMVIQRAVPDDCLSFENGLTGAMRQNPDYILIGEIRNFTEVSEFLRAAETGHLAMSTIHTVNNVTTLNRIRSLFSGEEQKRILATLGDVLRGIVNQVLVKSVDGSKRFAVREYLTIDYKIRKLIAEDRIAEIREYQEKNKMTMEHKLAEVYLAGKCSLKEARSKAPDQIYFDYVLKNDY